MTTVTAMGDGNAQLASPRPRIRSSESSRPQISRGPPVQPVRTAEHRDNSERGRKYDSSKALPPLPPAEQPTTIHTTTSSSSSPCVPTTATATVQAVPSPPAPPAVSNTPTIPTSSDHSSQRGASPSSTTNSNGDATTTTTTTTTTTGDPSLASIVPPLTRVHFYCYHSHRTLVPSRNTHNPMACMTCLRVDPDDPPIESGSSNNSNNGGPNGDGGNGTTTLKPRPPTRWRCAFCCLRICTDCKEGLGKCKDRSLMVFMEQLVNDLERHGKEAKRREEDAR